jgi:hypothetical protein
MNASTFKTNTAFSFAKFTFESFDFSFLAEKREEDQVANDDASAPQSRPQPIRKPQVKTCECRACFKDFPDVQNVVRFKTPYGPCCEPNAKKKDALIRAINDLKTVRQTEALQEPLVEPKGFRACANAHCRKMFKVQDPTHLYCRACGRDYILTKLAKKPSVIPPPAPLFVPTVETLDARVNSRADVLAPYHAKVDAERKLRKDLAEAFLKNNLPEGVTFTRNGTQTVFKLEDGRSLTIHIEKTEAELAAERAAKAQAEADRKVAEAKNEAERKRRAKEAAAEPKNNKKSKKEKNSHK